MCCRSAKQLVLGKKGSSQLRDLHPGQIAFTLTGLVTQLTEVSLFKVGGELAALAQKAAAEAKKSSGTDESTLLQARLDASGQNERALQAWSGRLLRMLEIGAGSKLARQWEETR